MKQLNAEDEYCISMIYATLVYYRVKKIEDIPLPRWQNNVKYLLSLGGINNV